MSKIWADMQETGHLKDMVDIVCVTLHGEAQKQGIAYSDEFSEGMRLTRDRVMQLIVEGENETTFTITNADGSIENVG